MSTTETYLKDASEHVSTWPNLLMSTPEAEALLILLAVIFLCILTVSVAIIWISCKLCARDCPARRRPERSTPPKTGVYLWDSMTSQKTHSPGRKFGLRLFKPIAHRLLQMRAKLNPEAENCNAEKLQEGETQPMTVTTIPWTTLFSMITRICTINCSLLIVITEIATILSNVQFHSYTCGALSLVTLA